MKKSIDLSEQLNDVTTLSHGQLLLADVYLKKKEYSRALEAAKRCCEVARDISDLYMLRDGYEKAYEISIASNKAKAADEYRKMYEAIDDTLRSQQEAENLARLELEMHEEKLEKLEEKKNEQIEALKKAEEEAEGRRNKTIAYPFYIILGVVALAVVLIFYFMGRNRRNKVH